MGNNLKKYSFNELLDEQGRIRIPKIQRDYAQGRRSKSVDKIRKPFVHTLLLVVKGKKPATELDFVYGSRRKDAFEPLDGQQRLTTLFLVHWMMGVELNVMGDVKHSKFTYETRNTSNEFCDELVQHKASQFVDEARKNKVRNDNKKKSGDKETKGISPSAIIKKRDWFKWEWNFDPTIASMLVMIDSIFNEMGDDWDKALESYRQNLKNITFNWLNLGDFGLSDELFIKMNARGKQLSDFDKLKSTLEEELQIQQKETNEGGAPLATQDNEVLWRSLMDGAWIDFFWHKYSHQIILKPQTNSDEDRKKEQLNAAKQSELQFKKLLLRLIALQLFENESTGSDLKQAAYRIDDSQIDDLLYVYFDSLIDWRTDENHSQMPQSIVTLDFNRLIEDLNLLIYKDNSDIYREISDLLPKTSHIDNDENTVFDVFLGNGVHNYVRLIFYAMLLFLRAFPPQKTKASEEDSVEWKFIADSHQVWLKNLEDWVRSTRNIFHNDNINQRIDKIELLDEATQNLKELVKDFSGFVCEHELNIETDKFAVKRFFDSSEKTYLRLDNQSLIEERTKARLILGDSTWEKCIDEAEKHPYLWGQIRCLLNWSGENMSLFQNYTERLKQLLDRIKEHELDYYSAILAFAQDCWKDNNRLYKHNQDRDNSFKRYLREHTRENQAYGSYLKELIDLWNNDYNSKSIDEFLNDYIETKKKDKALDQWVKCVLIYPSMLNEAWDKRIFKSRGHTIFAQRKTMDSHCFDPILVYLRNLCWSHRIDETKFKFYDSKGDYSHALVLEVDHVKYFVQWAESDGYYSITREEEGQEEIKVYNASELINYMEDVITNCNK